MSTSGRDCHIRPPWRGHSRRIEVTSENFEAGKLLSPVSLPNVATILQLKVVVVIRSSGERGVWRPFALRYWLPFALP